MDLEDTCLIFTMPNADTDSRIIFELIESFVSRNKNAHVFTSLGQLRYLSCIAQVDAVVGNSSSGLAEVPTFKKATINIVDRQKSRIQSDSVISCNPISADIKSAIKKSYTDQFRNLLLTAENPYGDGGAAQRIINTLGSVNIDSLVHKEFYDLESK